MKQDEVDFFHRATVQICGSLNRKVIMSNCMGFLKKYMPVDGISMGVVDLKSSAIHNVGRLFNIKLPSVSKVVSLPKAVAQEFVSRHEQEPFALIVNRPYDHPVGYHMWESGGSPNVSSLVMELSLDKEKIGAIFLYARKFDQYKEAHARLFSLLHDPFAVAMNNVLQHQELQRLQKLLKDDNQYLNRQLHKQVGDEIIGANAGLKEVMGKVRQVAPLSSQVLLLGETGVGKEVIANAIQHLSPRANGPFIKVNCGAIPENLLDSELFGHEKGAFTGAVTRKRGRFERAHKGTIFLDEIGELPPNAQVRLLRVIQNREIDRVGGEEPIPLDIRIIAATHQNLEQMVMEGRFREDLWFRLNVFPILIPPLRQRPSDIPDLVSHFIKAKGREMNSDETLPPTQSVMEYLQKLNWKGNIRELENMVERAMIQNLGAPKNSMLRFDPPASEKKLQGLYSRDAKSSPLFTLDQVMITHIRAVLQHTQGRIQGKAGAAAILDIHPSTLRCRMKKLGIPYGHSAQEHFISLGVE